MHRWSVVSDGEARKVEGGVSFFFALAFMVALYAAHLIYASLPIR